MDVNKGSIYVTIKQLERKVPSGKPTEFTTGQQGEQFLLLGAENWLDLITFKY